MSLSLSIRRNRLARFLKEAKNGCLKVLKNMPSGQKLNSVSFVFFLDQFTLLNDHVSDPTNDCDDSSNEETNDGKDAMPEVILDDHGYAKLPSRKEVSLKGQQELAQQMHLTVSC
jgi:hypothetical protein